MLCNKLPGRWLAPLLIALMTACEPQATPFPVDIPTPPTAIPTPGPPAPIRYALAPNTSGAVSDINQFDAGAQITQLDEPVNIDDLGARFDIIIAFGTYPDASAAPAPLNYALLINTALPPLDDPALAGIIARAVDPSALAPADDLPGLLVAPHESLSPVDLRADLANAGWPDGLDLRLAYEGTLGVNAAQAYFQKMNIQLALIPLQDTPAEAHLSLVAWVTPEQRDDWAASLNSEGQMIDLYSLPVSYWAVPGLTITFTPHGWPVGIRS